MVMSKVSYRVAKWLIEDPKVSHQLEAQLQPLLARAWNEGWTAATEHADKMRYAEQHWYPEEDLLEPDNPYELEA